MVLYAGGDKWAYPTIYEAPYTGGVVRRISRYLGDEYLPRRRKALSASTLLLDNPTAKTTNGTDLGGNWTRSTSTAGYLGDNYQVRAGTTATSWARWTPRFTSTGYYDVYLRWTAGWNRATNAKVTINTPRGQYVQYVDQTQQNGAWVWLGRYPANAGYNSGFGERGHPRDGGQRLRGGRFVPVAAGAVTKPRGHTNAQPARPRTNEGGLPGLPRIDRRTKLAPPGPRATAPASRSDCRSSWPPDPASPARSERRSSRTHPRAGRCTARSAPPRRRTQARR